MQSKERFCQTTTLGFPLRNKTDRKMPQLPWGRNPRADTETRKRGSAAPSARRGRGGKGQEGESGVKSSSTGSAVPDPLHVFLPPRSPAQQRSSLEGEADGEQPSARPGAARRGLARSRAPLPHGGAQPSAPDRQEPPALPPRTAPCRNDSPGPARCSRCRSCRPAPHSRQHGDGRPHHAVREAATLRVQPSPAAAIELLHLCLRFRHHLGPPPQPGRRGDDVTSWRPRRLPVAAGNQEVGEARRPRGRAGLGERRR